MKRTPLFQGLTWHHGVRSNSYSSATAGRMSRAAFNDVRTSHGIKRGSRPSPDFDLHAQSSLASAKASEAPSDETGSRDTDRGR